MRRCESVSGSHVCRAAAEPTPRAKATLCQPARRSRATACRRDEASRRRSTCAGGPAARSGERRAERAQRGRNEPPRRGEATPGARASAACATERNATRTHSRARGASGGPADGGRPREGGAEATAPAEQSERKPRRTAGAATRGGATGERANRRSRICMREHTAEAPSTRSGAGATGPGGRAPRSGASAGARPGVVRTLSRVVTKGRVERTTTLHSPLVFIDH